MGLLSLLFACSTPEPVIDLDGDGHAAEVDCDDADPLIHPGAPELCDGADQDCDGLVDEDPVDGITAWVDEDDDDYGGAEVQACRMVRGLIDRPGDCDDTDPRTHPDAEETCEHIDRNCDGDPHADAVDAFPAYADTDGDGYPGTVVGLVCELPEGTFGEALDCDESEPDIHPEAEEVCDEIDQDCDGSLGFDFIVGRDGMSVTAAINTVPDGGRVCILPGEWEVEAVVERRTVEVHGSGVGETVLQSGSRHFTVLGGTLDVYGLSVDAASVTLAGVAMARNGSLGLHDVDVHLLRAPAGPAEGLVVTSQSADVRLSKVTMSGVNLSRALSVRGALFSIEGGSLESDGLIIDGLIGPSKAFDTVGGRLFHLDRTRARLADLQVSDVAFDVGAIHIAGDRRIDALLLAALDSDVTITDAVLEDLRMTHQGDALIHQEGGLVRLEGSRVQRVNRVVLLNRAGRLEVRDTVMRDVHAAFAARGVTEVVFEDFELSGARTWGSSWGHFTDGARRGGSLEADRVRLIDNGPTHVMLRGWYMTRVEIRNLVSAGNRLTPEYVDQWPVWLQVDGILSGDGSTTSHVLVENAVVLDEDLEPYRDGSDASGVFAAGAFAGIEIRNAHFGPAWTDWDHGIAVGGASGVTLDHLTFEGDERPLAAAGLDSSVRTLGLTFNVDPQFVDTSAADPAAWDLRLRATSPLIDAGSPTILDADGTRSDIGAYGGPGGGTW